MAYFAYDIFQLSQNTVQPDITDIRAFIKTYIKQELKLTHCGFRCGDLLHRFTLAMP